MYVCQSKAAAAGLLKLAPTSSLEMLEWLRINLTSQPAGIPTTSEGIILKKRRDEWGNYGYDWDPSSHLS